MLPTAEKLGCRGHGRETRKVKRLGLGLTSCATPHFLIRTIRETTQQTPTGQWFLECCCCPQMAVQQSRAGTSKEPSGGVGLHQEEPQFDQPSLARLPFHLPVGGEGLKAGRQRCLAPACPQHG